MLAKAAGYAFVLITHFPVFGIYPETLQTSETPYTFMGINSGSICTDFTVCLIEAAKWIDSISMMGVDIAFVFAEKTEKNR